MIDISCVTHGHIPGRYVFIMAYVYHGNTLFACLFRSPKIYFRRESITRLTQGRKLR